MKIKKAMILAAGLGKRLRPVTNKIPKPLVTICNRSLLERCIDLLIKFGIKEIVLNVHYMPKKIENFLKKKKYKIKIKIISEKKKLLDTGGGVFQSTQHFYNDPFIVINPDTIWNKKYLPDLKKLETKYFKSKKCCLLLVDKKLSFDKSLQGDFSLDKKNLLFRNKKNRFIYTGLQIINRGVFRFVNKKIFSMNEIWDRLIPSKSIMGLVSNNNFYHLNTYKTYKNLKKIKNLIID